MIFYCPKCLAELSKVSQHLGRWVLLCDDCWLVIEIRPLHGRGLPIHED